MDAQRTQHRGTNLSVEPDTGESPGELVAGMAHDAKRLGDQYMELARIELKQLAKTLGTTTSRIVIGSSLLLVGTLFAGLALADAAVAMDVAPRWAALGAVAVLLLIVGIAFLMSLRSSAHDAA